MAEHPAIKAEFSSLGFEVPLVIRRVRGTALTTRENIPIIYLEVL